ncbi:PREDICTED: uncharacterized protein LOC109214933 [Nicotiana attenuata]|uniref:uncharacterized protein LOC109214933 n=1 Tax=Nicotiana attenuata TaxID=49451 RepID=UPI0009045E9E|nr:PREDICTED: uncharacterized protein LOC109214933 [Nicotiana attenuata]
MGNKNLFKKVTKISGGSVKFGDDSKEKLVGTGTVRFNNNCDITEAYIVNGLNYNLLSISQLCDSGYEVKFKKTGCAVEDGSSKTILLGKRYGNVYILDGIESLDSHICLASISDDPWLWHMKLGHASMHLIEKLSKHDLVIGLPKLYFFRNHVFDACQIGKQTRNSFKNKDIVSATKPLQLFHMDLFGPTRTASIGAIISQIEPKKVEEALKDSGRVQAMQEELDKFDKNQVWELLPKPANTTIVGTKWVFRNKLNEDRKVV